MLDRAISFGPYRLEPRSGLKVGERDVRLTPKALGLLSFLAARPGEVVSKDEIFQAVWPETAVSDAALVTCIQELRKALRDDARQPRYIETLHRRGYRFIANPSANKDAAPGLPLPDRPSIALLPFSNMSGDPEQDYFADGISEDLITGLSRIRWLFVIARNSSFTYKGRAVDVKQVGLELGVRYVLEGSVRRAGTTLRVSAQLIDATTGAHHWAERYDRDATDIFRVQDEITASVAAAIEPKLLAAEGVRALSRSAADLDAWAMVARAQTHFLQSTREDHAAGVKVIREAVDTYPDYAPAHGLLGWRLVYAVHMGWANSAELSDGHRHALRAIALDEHNSWGHIALGYWAMMERRTEESIAAFKRALVLNPNSAAAHSYLGHIFAFSGRYQEAFEHSEVAIRLSPLDPEMAFFLGGLAVASFCAGHYADAEKYTTQALRLRPGFQGAQRLRCASVALLGRTDEAQALYQSVRREQPKLSSEWARANAPYQTPELLERYIEGLRKAGMDA